MDNVKVIEVTQIDGTTIEMVEVELPNGGLLSTTKEHWEKTQAEQSTPSVIDEAEAK